MYHVKLNSVALYGLEPFVVSADVVYLHTAEKILLADPQLAVPVGAGSIYQEGYPAWADNLVREGCAWLPDETKMLDHLVSLIPLFVPEGEQNDVYQAIKNQKVRIAPFATPICFKDPGGQKHWGRGLARKEENLILILRSFLAHEPFGVLSALYHEGLHIVQDADELQAHSGQLALLESAGRWLQSQNQGVQRQDLSQLMNSIKEFCTRISKTIATLS